MTKKEIKGVLDKHGIAPNKRLGQSFLIDKNILDKIIQTAHISKNDIILEIGAGLGNLTKKLAQEARKVITIEKDKQLIEPLKENLKDFKNIEIIQGDVLKKELKLPSNYKIISNIPYYLTSPVTAEPTSNFSNGSSFRIGLPLEPIPMISSCDRPPS